jgi:uncharacterized protein
MKVLVQITHPAHVHLFKNYIWELEQEGHEVKILMRNKSVTKQLLDYYEFDYVEGLESAAINPTNPTGVYKQAKFEYKTLQLARSFEPDLLTGLAGIGISHAGKLLDIPMLSYNNNEHATLENKLSVPFADKVYTHEYYWKDLGEHHVRYPGYHELAYLHPNRFDPDPAVFDHVAVSPNDKFAILRLVAWEAAHDAGQSGFSDPIRIIEKLADTGTKVLVSSERDIKSDPNIYNLDIPPYLMHDLLYYSDLFIGESGTMACESAVLGTPSVYVSSIRLGYLDELESKYGLTYNFSGPNNQRNSIEKAITILQKGNNNKFENRKKRLLNDKIDTTEFMLEQTEMALKE